MLESKAKWNEEKVIVVSDRMLLVTYFRGFANEFFILMAYIIIDILI